MSSLLRVEHVTISYNGKPISVEKVDDLTLNITLQEPNSAFETEFGRLQPLPKQGEILGIVGESGSGKSTIIKAVMGLLGEEGLVTKGDIWYKGENLTDMSTKELRRYLGKEIGMVFQDCKSALCPVRKIGAQIYEAVSEHEKASRHEVRNRAGEIMKKIGLNDADRVLDSYPFELSGGMNQRVGICTAMILHPNLLLADEPTSALDVTVQKQVAEELLFMRKTYNTAMILVTHNIGVVRMMADRILVLQNGQAREYGETEAVLDHPKDPYTKKLMSSVLHLKRAENQEVR